eukprot:15472474-Alexandrium_andersonii.AAC.1
MLERRPSLRAPALGAPSDARRPRNWVLQWGFSSCWRIPDNECNNGSATAKEAAESCRRL